VGSDQPIPGIEQRASAGSRALPDGEKPGGKKRDKLTLIGLLSLACCGILILLAALYVVPTFGLRRIHPDLPLFAGLVTALLAGAVVLTGGLLVIVTWVGRDVPLSRALRSTVVKTLLPVLVVVGRMVGLDRERVQHAFVAVNNDLVVAHCKNGHRPQRILLLMPHCLQDSECTVKVTHHVDNCKRCGKCAIKDLLELSEKYAVDLAVATGGTIARRIVVEKRPDLIIAVACERDLTSGIQDTTPLPVYGIFNRRPHGPCLNTQVSIDTIESVLQDLALRPKAES
jgi:hypothetical protein